MRRREFIALIGGAAAWPLPARTEQPAMPMIGWLGSGSSDVFATNANAFRNGLSEIGFADGKNVRFESRWADGQYDRLPGLAADLVRHQPAVMCAAAGAVTALAARAATTTIPIVFVNGNDPVKFGLVSSLSHPGGNLTGVVTFSNGIEAKRLQLLHELIPAVTVVGLLVNPKNADADAQVEAAQAAAATLGLELHAVAAGTESEIDSAFTSFAEQRIGALLICSDSFFHVRTEQLIALCARQAIPAMYFNREQVLAGALLYYGNSFVEAYRQAGIYAGRILKGERPGDIPVLLSTKFELVINMKTAKALGLTIPSGVVAIADDVIE
jgi:putative tryptophan/tyrosine transport system substrate-binding protein